MRARIATATAGAGVLLLLTGAALATGPDQHAPPARATRRIMGTFYDVQAYHADPARAQAAVEAALDAMQAVDDRLSNYRPDTELSRMNAAAFDAPFAASPALFAFLEDSARWHDVTGGAFDPTVGPLVRAWGFFGPAPARPTPAAVSAARAAVGFDKVRLDPATRAVRFLASGMEVDPGGIGKGVAADRAIEALAAAGITSALVSAGGSTVRALGHPPHRPGWRVAVRNPANADRPLAIVTLTDASLSTSGVSEKFVQEGNRRLSHLFDPRTGEPVAGMCQVTVIAPRATASDALTKSAFIDSREAVTLRLRGLAGVHAMRVEGDCASPTLWHTPWSAGVFAR